MNKRFKVLSLCDGMSCCQIALTKLGVSSDYTASEIDKNAIRVTQHNFPSTDQAGDVTQLDTKHFKDVDLLAAGTPCTDFSFAGRNEGMVTDCKTEILSLEHYLQLKSEGYKFKGQSYLFWEFVRVLQETKPRYFLLENVKMKPKWEQVLSEAVGFRPTVINSNIVSAQNRHRLYWLGERNDAGGYDKVNVPQPEDRKIFWKDIREHGVSTRTYYFTNKAMAWLHQAGVKRNQELKVWGEDHGKFECLTASHAKSYGNQRFWGIPDIPNDLQAIAAMRGRYVNGNSGKTKQYIEFRRDGKSNTLTTVSKDNVVVPMIADTRVEADRFFFRYITPTEAERLQTVPVGYTDCLAKSHRLKVLGNGWTVDVIVHLLSHISLRPPLPLQP